VWHETSLGLVINHTTRACVVQGVTLNKRQFQGNWYFWRPARYDRLITDFTQQAIGVTFAGGICKFGVVTIKIALNYLGKHYPVDVG